MGKRLSKTATVALGVGLIAEGSKQASQGSWKSGGLMVIVGIAVVYGYEVLQEKQIEEVFSNIQDTFKDDE